VIGIRGRGSARAGIGRCGFSRLGYILPAPIEHSGIRAVAEYLRTFWKSGEVSRCGLARCGYTHLARTGNIYAGQVPIVCTETITAALTENPGGPRDPRQIYATAYDNPGYTLHIIGDDLVCIDEAAETIRAGADMTAHITTDYGTINGLRIGPAKRTVRTFGPRYDIQMTITAEFIREIIQEE